MEDNENQEAGATATRSTADSPQATGFDLNPHSTKTDTTAASADTMAPVEGQLNNGTIRTLDGELASDEMEQDAINYQILLGKIDKLLERLRLDA